MTRYYQQLAPWRAGQWERANAETFSDWRRQSYSFSYWQLQTVCQAVDVVIRRHVTNSHSANAVARALRPTRVGCDALTFSTIDETLAYLVQHLADRYGRVTQVLERLLAVGHLPIRKIRMAVLDIGAGPAPALYAAYDFYDDLRAWIENVGQNVQVAPITDAHALDRGPAWDSTLHELSEQLMEVRQLPGLGGSLPFRREHMNLTDFSVREVHMASRESAIRRIMYEFDMANEPISRHWAQIFAIQENKYSWPPSAYDIVVLCNFLTNTTITGQFAREIRSLGRSLTPGGVLIALGGTGGQYPTVWSRLDTFLRISGLVKLGFVSVQMRANDDPAHRELIRTHMFDSMDYILRLCSEKVRREVEADTRMLSRDAYVELEFPRFQVQCWKNQAHHRGRQHRRVVSNNLPSN